MNNAPVREAVFGSSVIEEELRAAFPRDKLFREVGLPRGRGKEGVNET